MLSDSINIGGTREKIIGNKLKSWVRHIMFLLNICWTVMTIVVHSDASRQEHQKKERHTIEKDDKFRCKQKDNQLYNILKKTRFLFQTDKGLKYSLHMFDTQRNDSMNNVIAYVAPKNKTMTHIMSLNNTISCVVRISILGFKTYWKQVYNVMHIKSDRRQDILWNESSVWLE